MTQRHVPPQSPRFATTPLFAGLPGDVEVSFEFFPPRSEQAEAGLLKALAPLASLSPAFVSMTYGAGGSTRERSFAAIEHIMAAHPGLPVAAHLTCVAASRAETHDVADRLWDMGVRHVVALRGDAGAPGAPFAPHPQGYTCAAELVAGCDVWVNLPRPPQEASGTSGMKACLNGGLHLSVLDGWWAEAYDGTNGWAIDGAEDPDEAGQDRRDAAALFDLLEHQVVPEFHDRGDDGIPHRWVERIRRSLITNGPAFSADRMVRQYADEVYPPPGSERHGHGGEDDRFAMPWALGGDER